MNLIKDDATIRQARVLTGPYQISVDITNKCNYRCIHCYNGSGENYIVNDDMSDEQLQKLFTEISEIIPVNVCFCGGEPLLRLDIMCECAEILTSNGTSIVSLVSNGYLMTQEVAKRLKRSNIKRVQISLDGATSETCARLRKNDEAFNRAVNALKILVDNDMIPNIAFAPTAFNIDEFDEVCRICENIGVADIRVQPMMIIGRAQDHIKELVPSKEQYIRLKRKIDDINTNSKTLSIDWGDPVDHIYRYRTDMKNIFTFVSIKANGDIPVSPYMPLIVGNITRHSFKEYWDKGLPSIWSLGEAQEFAKEINCIRDMSKPRSDGKRVWFDEDVKMDIIDDNIRIWKDDCVAEVV